MPEAEHPERHHEPGVRAEVGNIGAIEGLRGVAVLVVVCFHYFVLRASRREDPWIAMVDAWPALKLVIVNGYLGVDLFFLITGFLLTLPWFRHALEGREPPSVREFYRRRVRRIVPAYYVQLAFMFAVMIPVVLGTEFWLRNLPFTLLNLAAHAGFLHYLTPVTSASLSLNGALWTLALEFQYYLLLPLLAPCFVRAPWLTALLAVAAASTWRLGAAHGLQPLVDFEMALGAPWNLGEDTIRHLLATQLPGYLAHFALGVLAGRAWLLRRDAVPSALSQLAWTLAAMLALAGLYQLHARGGAGDFTWLAVALAMAIAMHALVTGAPRVGRVLLANAPLSFVGRVSYSAYLYHLPLLLVWNKYVPDLQWAGFALYLTLVFGVATLSYRFVELPFMARTGATKPG